ncbi:sugar isomerase domain-containing protein [Pseudoclavibacter sp. VKM Ac-2867]|uniref:sugar isomerase domain-containing protein n=1 Tax=Pseudoclavibacter sp. VKM Ac-2867 TaxID=2783829 RepID=UPI00188AB7C5|nr:sugar isomerase domain-containing protein [Pseudoclavibacter sp. VKM Ac-2867]MBF4459400.1 sugar isomerase domain-containing protein [Pseudoclavibacter sp. VKM Ac-2867]
MAVTTDIATFIDQVLTENDRSTSAAARAIARTGRSGGLVRPAGAGHSLAAVLETFFRAGGLAFVSPLWHPEVLPFFGARSATSAERRPGLGRDVAEKADLAVEDTVVIFSNSGVNPYPVEIAEVAKDRGATVIAFTSLQATRSAPRRSTCTVASLADIVVDTAVPPGDVSWPTNSPVTSPVSSIANTALWTTVLRKVYDLDADLPLWRSANVDGNDTHNTDLVTRFQARVPAL